MSIQLTIAEQEAIGYVDLRTISFQDGAAARGDSLSFEVTIPFSDLGTVIDKPRPGNVVVLSVDGTKYFEGPIIRVNDRFLNPETMLVSVECADYTHFLDRKLVTKTEYPEQLAGERIKQILTEFAGEFTQYDGWDNEIEDGLLLPTEGYDYEAISSIIDRICDATGYGWFVSFDQTTLHQPKVYFFAGTSVETRSPLYDTYSDVLDLDTNPEIGGVTVDEDISELHNVIIVKDFSEKSSEYRTDEFTADGTQTFFKLYMEPFDLSDTRVSVQVGGVGDFFPRTVAIDPLTSDSETIEGVPGIAYLCILNWGVRFPTADMPQLGDVIRVEYKPTIPERVIPVIDPDSIAEMARRQGNDGIYESMVSLPDYRVDSSKGYNPAEYYGQMLLRRHAWPLISGSFTVYEPSPITEMMGWRSGQSFKLTSEIRDIYDVEYWVKHGRTTEAKIPVTVWITNVERRIVEVTDTATRFETTISFSTVLRR